MTRGSDPHGSSMATRRNPWLCQARRVGEARTPMALGRTPLPTAHDRLLAQVTSGGRSPPTIVERPLCSVPRQDDFPRGNVPTAKGALRSIHRNLDDRPISMKLYEFAAIDGPEQTSATEMHQRVIAMATE